MTYEELIQEGIVKLSESGIEEAEINAYYLMQAAVMVTGRSYGRTEHFLWKKDEVDDSVVTDFREKIAIRSRRIPLEHITGFTEFMGIRFSVNENVLIPRQDTECLVERALEISEGKDVLDLCTGSGCIGISIAKLGSPKSVTLADVSERALEVARENWEAVREEIDPQVRLVQGDLYENLADKYDIIVSNPPYIRSSDIEDLMPEVRDYDPMLALDGGEDGLVFYRRIVGEGRRYLNANGVMLLEIGCDQGEEVSRIMQENDFTDIAVIKDLAGLDRVVFGRYGGI
ncbi:peptide chain release factor N(5)-glutamine methyltransferase [Eubacterium xylanophilum]|uniref:peptide chain release factor N(5)-glutamine methyltransferase n=1 Tax=Eubacterium xylanophilum TaxID=39497 RepID=UPI00047D812F|nr:peptide chain release factor N(5)-glutamine methyltransferase [Eubacterium xylanophilum]